MERRLRFSRERAGERDELSPFDGPAGEPLADNSPDDEQEAVEEKGEEPVREPIELLKMFSRSEFSCCGAKHLTRC